MLFYACLILASLAAITWIGNVSLERELKRLDDEDYVPPWVD